MNIKGLNEIIEIDYCQYKNDKLMCPTMSSIIPIKMYYKSVPLKPQHNIRICCVSDTHSSHNYLINIPPCDIFIHTGDILIASQYLTNEIAISKLKEFNIWVGKIPATYRIVIGGNHDKICETIGKEKTKNILNNAIYLCNEIIEICGLTLFGTPYSFGKSTNNAFQNTQFQKEVIDTIQYINHVNKKIDILITHGPSDYITRLVKPNLAHIWGHIHEYRGIYFDAFCSNNNTTDTINNTPIVQNIKTLTPSNIDNQKDIYDIKTKLNTHFTEYQTQTQTQTHTHQSSINENKIWLSICCAIMNTNYVPYNIPFIIDLPFNSKT